MTTFFDGMLYGLVFLVSLGPAFFAFLQTAIKHGFLPAMCTSLGLIMMDAVLIGLVLVGLGKFFQDPEVKFWFGLVGAVVLVGMGIGSWMRKARIKGEEETQAKSLWGFWFKGVAVNAFNPLVLVFWIGAVGLTSGMGYSSFDQIWFFTGFLLTMFLVDVFKATVITRFTSYITEKTVVIINRVVGTAFLIFGVRIFVFMMGWW